MANIKKELNDIKTAVYGRDVRGSIHDGIDKINKESEGSRTIVNENKNRQDSLEQQFDDLQQNYSEGAPSTAEVVAARTNTETSENYNTIGRRMDEEYKKVTSQLNDTNSQLALRPTEEDVQEKLFLKRDKNIKIKNDDLDISSDANKIKLINLSDEVQQALTGNAPALPDIPSEGVTQEKIAPKGVDFRKHTKQIPLVFKTRPKNLYDKNAVTVGSYVAHGSGNLVTNANYVASDYMPIESGVYSIAHQRQGAFYDANKVYISGFNLSSVNPGTITAPANAKYLRISALVAENSDMMVVQGDTLGEYEPYYTEMKINAEDYLKINTVGSGLLKDNTVTKTKMSTPYQLGFLVRGNVNINTISKTITFPGSSSLIFTNDYFYQPSTEKTINYSSSDAIFMYYDTETNDYLINEGRSGIPAKRLLLLGVFYQNKVYNSMSPGRFVINEIPDATNEKYTLTKVYKDWIGGLKSPITFLGDSTIDGSRTTGNTPNEIGADHQDPNTFTTKLQQLLRKETGNNVLRIYNAGFAGQQADWAFDNIEAIMAPYADSKMVAIGYGINDRLTNQMDYYNRFYERIEKLINWCFDKSYTPLLITTQAIRSLGLNSSDGKGRSSESVNSIANKVKFDLSNKYNLELIDINTFTNDFMNYSAVPIDQIIADELHFTNAGHQYEAELLFASIVPRVNWVKDNQKHLITLVDQKSKTDVLGFENLSNGTGKFKNVFNFTRTETSELLLHDAWIFNATKGKIKVTGHGDASVFINNQPATSGTSVELDLGLHHLVAKTTSTNVNWEGFEVISV